MKLKNDAYYTDDAVAKHCVEKVEELFGSSITSYVEPSAGGGAFLNYLNKPVVAYDIDPKDDRIITQDFLKLNLDYVVGRCAIGNPPFGSRSNMALNFIKYSIKSCDYVAFILPIGQLNNDRFNYCKLVYSEDLGLQNYTDTKLHCCFNVYKKQNNVKEKVMEHVHIVQYRRLNSGHLTANYKNMINKNITPDIRICAFGQSCGKIVSFNEQYCDEYAIFVLNENKKEEILQLIQKIYKSDFIKSVSITAYRLTQLKLHNYLNQNL